MLFLVGRFVHAKPRLLTPWRVIGGQHLSLPLLNVGCGNSNHTAMPNSCRLRGKKVTAPSAGEAEVGALASRLILGLPTQRAVEINPSLDRDRPTDLRRSTLVFLTDPPIFQPCIRPAHVGAAHSGARQQGFAASDWFHEIKHADYRCARSWPLQ